MARQYDELFQSVLNSVTETDVQSLNSEMQSAKPPVVVDVREREEWEQGYIPGSIFIPRGFLEMRIEDRVPDKDAPICVYCAGGVRSAFAAKAMEQLGYTNVRSVAGGFSKWKDAGLPFETPRNWARDQLQRYSRHFLIPE